MLNIKNLTFSYSPHLPAVINDVSMDIAPGSVYALLGPNGAGKSTLLYLISGLLTPQEGSVDLYGVNTRLRRPSSLADIFLVPEEFILPNIKLSEYAKLYAPFYPRFSYEDMLSNLSTFEMPGDPNLGALSMGQKKKVMMSFALATNTPLLLMDEPTNGLDIPSKASFRSFISSHMTDERAIIISTHQVADVSKLLDQVIIMDNNHIVLQASTFTITQRLAFLLTTDPDIVAQALLAKPAINGMDVVILNPDGEIESEINLELLFELATKNPALMAQLFGEPVTPPPFMQSQI